MQTSDNAALTVPNFLQDGNLCAVIPEDRQDRPGGEAAEGGTQSRLGAHGLFQN